MRLTLLMYGIDELSARQTAEMLGITFNAAKSRIIRGRQALRNKIRRNLASVVAVSVELRRGFRTQEAKIKWVKKKNPLSPHFVEVPDTLKSVAFIEKDSRRFPGTHGWTYAKWDYDPASGTFTPTPFPQAAKRAGTRATP